jgi:hypothetical protein
MYINYERQKSAFLEQKVPDKIRRSCGWVDEKWHNKAWIWEIGSFCRFFEMATSGSSANCTCWPESEREFAH